MPYCTGSCTVARGSAVQIVQLLYDLLLIGKVLACAAAAAGQIKNRSGRRSIGRLTRTSFLFGRQHLLRVCDRQSRSNMHD